MDVFTWILVGTAIGWGTGKILKGEGYGPIMDGFMGASGAIVGGFLISMLELSGYRGFALTTIGAMICAVAVTLLTGYLNGRRLYAHQL
jgi:uncharacterized membrane protein YeaQ/YmgE (transglycosylase-associated protein family)